MAEEKKDAYPMLSAKSWWTLRKKLQSTPTMKVTVTALASLLDMKETSVKSNALNHFKQIGLLEEDGSPNDLAMKWRLDDSYPEACEEIRKKCYPQEIIDLYPTSDAKPAAVKQWFMNTAHVGEAAASKQASFYLLITEADPTKTAEVPKTSNGTTPKKPEKPTSKPAATDTSKTEKPTPVSPPAVPAASNFPALHIDVQIHIAPDTSAEQIDRIFASMAKHLNGIKGNTVE